MPLKNLPRRRLLQPIHKRPRLWVPACAQDGNRIDDRRMAARAITRTFGSALASLAYTTPKAASPRATRRNAARTFSASATRGCNCAQMPSDSNAALAYLPAGTLAVSASAR